MRGEGGNEEMVEVEDAEAVVLGVCDEEVGGVGGAAQAVRLVEPTGTMQINMRKLLEEAVDLLGRGGAENRLEGKGGGVEEEEGVGGEVGQGEEVAAGEVQEVTWRLEEGGINLTYRWSMKKG